MQTRDFESLLQKLQDSTRIAEKRRLTDQLHRAASRVDARLRRRFIESVLAAGLRVPTIEPLLLGVGEGWILLFEAPDRGRVFPFRLAVGKSPSSHKSSLLLARQGLASAAGRQCREFRYESSLAFDAASLCPEAEIEGTSLQLSLAMAILSLATDSKPRTDTAGTAAITPDGKLRRVSHLVEKVQALQECWPEVTRLVVAEGQARAGLDRLPLSIEIIEAASIEDAACHWGLSFSSLAAGNFESFQSRVSEFERWNQNLRSVDDWIAHCNQALEAVEALREHDPERSMRAQIWASFFALHAGHPELVDNLTKQIPLDSLHEFPELYAKKAICEASIEVDTDPVAAVLSATRAVLLVENLDSRCRKEFLGQALGTRGRALMHAGRLDEALDSLKQGQEHHKNSATERAHSACYTSTCLRKMGLAEEALLLLREVSAPLEALCVRSEAARTTRSYLQLERGRILLELGCLEEALADFISVRDAQDDAHSYPRLGAARGMALAHRRLGRSLESDEALLECIGAARAVDGVLRQAAAAAAGEALLDGGSGISPIELQKVWNTAFGETAGPIKDVLSLWVY